MFLYIDPGTGSMLFSILIGVVSTLFFFGRKIFLKIKFIFTGGKAEKINNSKIPYVIFSDHKRYWNVFKPICDEFEKNGVDISYWTASPDDPALSEKYEHVKTEFIGEGNKAFARLNMMNAGIVLSTTPGLDVYQWKRSRNVDWYAHIVHMATDITTYRMLGLDFYDSVLVSGSYQLQQVKALETRRNLPSKEIKVVGCTYMDSLKKKLDSSKRISGSDRKTVLVAPSWGNSGILAKYGEKIIDALIATGYKIIVRPHPQSFTAEKEMLESLMERYPETEAIKWNRDNDNFNVLNEADILITDFSGIILDYSLVFNKPVIFADTTFDPTPYDAAWISKPLWIFQNLDKIGIKLNEADFGNMKAIIDCAIDSKILQSGREEVREECWANIGSSAKTVFDYLTAKHEELNEKKLKNNNINTHEGEEQ